VAEIQAGIAAHYGHPSSSSSKYDQWRYLLGKFKVIELQETFKDLHPLMCLMSHGRRYVDSRFHWLTCVESQSFNCKSHARTHGAAYF